MYVCTNERRIGERAVVGAQTKRAAGAPAAAPLSSRAEVIARTSFAIVRRTRIRNSSAAAAAAARFVNVFGHRRAAGRRRRRRRVRSRSDCAHSELDVHR